MIAQKEKDVGREITGRNRVQRRQGEVTVFKLALSHLIADCQLQIADWQSAIEKKACPSEVQLAIDNHSGATLRFNIPFWILVTYAIRIQTTSHRASSCLQMNGPLG